MKTCKTCKYLSKQTDHLNPYMQDHFNKEEHFTCLYPHPFTKTWAFGLGRYSNEMVCAGHWWTAKELILKTIVIDHRLTQASIL